MPRIALRIAYDGTCFHGFQRQPEKRTVEGDLILALRKIRAIGDSRVAKYRLSSRTDRGVSALCNVVSIDTAFPREQIPRALNSNVNDLWCTGTALLPDDFDVRLAVSRVYTCYLYDDGQNITSMREAGKTLLGTHDFSSYAKVEGRNPIRTVKRIAIRRRGSLIEFAVEGESFLWNQVRRMVWAMDQVGGGKAKASDISPGDFKLKKVGLAPAENLILTKVDIGVKFQLPEQLGRSQSDISRRLVLSKVKSNLLSGMLDQLARSDR